MKKVLKIIGIAVLAFFALAFFVGFFGGDAGTSSTPAPAPAQAPKVYRTGETWAVNGQWELTVNGIEEQYSRNEYADKYPAAVYVVSFTYTNIGYTDRSGIMDGLFFSMDNSVIDSKGTMGYSYPGDIAYYPQEAPIGATCKGQVCIGVDNPGLPIKLNVVQYDGTGQKQAATFSVE